MGLKKVRTSRFSDDLSEGQVGQYAKNAFAKDPRSQSQNPDSRFPRRAFLTGVSIGAISMAVPFSLPTLAAEGTSVPTEPGLFEVIYSMRAMRRLKPDPIPDETLKKIVEAGIHAPSGGNRQDWGFILVRDPELKRFIRDRYREAQQKLQAGRPPLSELPPERQRAVRAGMYLSEHMHEAPVILMACSAKAYPSWGDNQRASVATVHGSIYPAVQNILLACRAFGIGATLTTTHFFFEEELKQKLGVPENMEIAALLPLGYPRGKFGKTTRKPVIEVLYWNRWGNTTTSGTEAVSETAKKDAARRPVRQVVTSKKFTPAVVEFLKKPWASQLVTTNPNGSPQVTIMWFKYEDGALLFTTTTDRIKFRNMQKDPRATLVVMDPTNMYKWVIVHGKLSVVDSRDPVAFYRGLAEHYLGAEELVEWRKTAMMDNRTVLKLTPTQIRTMGFPQA
jgi:PPOX class probable F420-dependent enzyme